MIRNVLKSLVAASLLVGVGALAGENLAAPVRDGDKFIFMGKDGKAAFETKFDIAREFSDGMAAINIGAKHGDKGKWGYIDAKGKIVVEPKFDIAEDFYKGAAFVANKDAKGAESWGMVGKSGKILLKTEYHGLYRLEGALVLAKKDDKYAMFDRTGKELLPLKFQMIRSSNVDENVIFAQQSDKWGMFNASGKQIIAPKFDAVGDFAHNKNMWASVQKSGKWGMIDKSGEEVVAAKFDEELKFDEYGVAPTALDGKKILIDINGKEIAKAK